MLVPKSISVKAILGMVLIACISVGCSQQGGTDTKRAIAKKEIVYSVPAMHCDGCVRAISDALTNLPGIDSVNVQLENYTAYVRVDTTKSDAATIAKTIDGLGYTATRK